MSLRYFVILIAILPFFRHDASGARKDSGKEFFLETYLSNRDATEGEAIIYEVILFTQNPMITSVGRLASPDFGIFPANRSAADSQLSEVEIDGTMYYKVVIDRYFIGAVGKGKYSIKGGSYKIFYNTRVRRNSPFNPGFEYVTHEVDLKASPADVKVSSLPEKGCPENFSGAVGDFRVSTTVPEGTIRAGSKAVMIINISGRGDLTNVDLSKVAINLPEGLQFKSMTDSRQYYVQHGQLGSEMEIELTFLPRNAGEFVVDDISLAVFNPAAGKYTTVVTEPVKIIVEESIPSSSGNSPIHI